IYAQHIVVLNEWRNFKKNLLVLKEEPDNYFAREYIISYNEIFLNKIDRLVNYYEEDAVHEEILKYQLLILVFGTIIILVTWLVVRRIIYKSGIDQLTRVYNRRRGAQHLRDLMQKSMEKNKDLSLIILDIDDFKKINDTYGHNTGDDVLKEIVEVVRSSIRDKDTLVRWGGEEFLILTPDVDLDSAVSVAERVRETVADHQFAEVGHITCSFGVTQLKNDEEDESLSEFIKRADDALYYAKGNSKNMVSSKE
ncbi:MAG: GGDEF domain-containing protein, partial [Bacillota bacterium]